MVGNKAQKAVAAALTGILTLGTVAPAFARVDGRYVYKDYNRVDPTLITSVEGVTYFDRIAGENRYGTAQKLVDAVFKGSSQYAMTSSAVLASGENFPDALAANGLAGAKGIPLLLTGKDALPAETKASLKNYKVNTLYVMGGESAISKAVRDEIISMGITIRPVAGDNRQDTSVAAMNEIRVSGWSTENVHTVIVATGSSYADALSIAPYAYHWGAPILLTGADGMLTDAEIAAIKANEGVENVIVVGGTSAVSDGVFGQIAAINASKGFNINVQRLAGGNRYETSVEVAKWLTGDSSMTYTVGTIDDYFDYGQVFIATGENFADALAGAQLAGGLNSYYYTQYGSAWTKDFDEAKYYGSPILLVGGDSTAAADWLQGKHEVKAAEYFSDSTDVATLGTTENWKAGTATESGVSTSKDDALVFAVATDGSKKVWYQDDSIHNYAGWRAFYDAGGFLFDMGTELTGDYAYKNVTKQGVKVGGAISDSGIKFDVYIVVANGAKTAYNGAGLTTDSVKYGHVIGGTQAVSDATVKALDKAVAKANA